MLSAHQANLLRYYMKHVIITDHPRACDTAKGLSEL